MNLAQLKKKGGVIVDALVAKKIEWKHLDVAGKEVTDEFTVHVRRHSFGAMEQMYAADESKASRNARYLADSIMLGKDGDEPLPYEDAVNLDQALGLLLLKAVNEVNNPEAKS
ncbi:phage tail assembly chaperone family protein, TAC [Pseudomonas sp. SWRI51]|uniref:phage tail assembly chaperone family protein, TAC n=1 Tax=Pseudomonas sp. SWRI51 TaxID=2745491 RepID=UPI00164619ED|nr:phage tail assembly chaperone family protein, TAC [Pseudomonas sp. SWRI51]MBC3411280.1 phage tail assembly chaperone family protein, TAC [Pseudomonas sp. SWRI51]